MQAKLQSLMAYGRYYMAVVIGLGLALVLMGGLYAFHKISQYENNSVKSQTSQIPTVPDGTSTPGQ